MKKSERENKVENKVGRCLPTPKCHTLSMHHPRILAPYHVIAKFHFWYFVSQLKKMKPSGEIVYYTQVLEKVPSIGEECGYPAAAAPTACTRSMGT
uniref:Ribosomal protein 50S-L18Ae/60S-L20/60S-L18A domain-containing protein n=2 Tax=Canis lupus familiaris TaxID=9615 RepID=A0A8C0T1F6_CANLF